MLNLGTLMTSARLVHIDGTTSASDLGAMPCALVVGNFDGVHRGHQTVLREAVAEAQARGLEACVLTFDPHPGAVVGAGAPPLLTTLETRAELIGEIGVPRMYVRRFDADFASWSPERFARELVSKALGARVVVVGENFRFGARRSGNLPLLQALGKDLGFEARVHSVATDARGRFSSTRAREAIAAGDVAEARNVLGRPHAMTGVVVHGDHRGRTIDFPTANLGNAPELHPRNGVYAVTVDAFDEGAGRFHPLGQGITNVGMRPTVGGNERRIETYLFAFSGDLYGKRLRVHVMARLRDEMKFGSVAELKAQIERDAIDARDKLVSCFQGPVAP
jgi:riboflavin kinase/FMN adenylyltransferase